MKDVTYVIKEVAKRTGYSEEIVTEVVRAAAHDCRKFMEEKRGYSIYFPRLGTFSYRVMGIKDYVQRQRRYLAYWIYRLSVGHSKASQRTIDAGRYNINVYQGKIKASLLIKQEFLKDHSKYHEFKTDILTRDTVTDIGRLEQLLQVEEIVQELKERYTGKESDLPRVPDEEVYDQPNFL